MASRVPALTTRRAETTVELGSGQSFMIAGLLQNSNSNSIEKAPFLGDIPVLGALFRSTKFQRDETELVIIVTPYLVKPVSASWPLRLTVIGRRTTSSAISSARLTAARAVPFSRRRSRRLPAAAAWRRQRPRRRSGVQAVSRGLTEKDWTMRSKIILIALASSRGGLQHAGPSADKGVAAVNVPVVTTADYVFDAAAPDGALAPGETDRLNGWFQGLGLGYGDSIYVDGAYADAARGQVAAVAGQYGMLVSAGAPVTPGVGSARRGAGRR